jgi:hypothetical protein
VITCFRSTNVSITDPSIHRWRVENPSLSGVSVSVRSPTVIERFSFALPAVMAHREAVSFAP